MMKSYRDIFNKNGCINIKNILMEKEKRIILNIIYESFYKALGLKNKKIFSIEDKNFHKKLTFLRNNNPKVFGNIYDKLLINAQLRSIFYTKKMLKTFSKILNTKIENIYLNGFMLRLDSPTDNRNSLDWHQDTPYYPETYPKMNAGVCWMAITRNSFRNGTLVYIPKSHHKLVKSKSFKKGKHHSEQKKISISKNEMLRKKNLNLSFGDASFIHMNIKHRSGKNNSNKFRITLGCRFHDMQ